MSMNHTSLMGRLVKDPEVRHTGSGKAVCSFTVAVDNPGRESASFINCVAWEKTANFLANYFSKGSLLALEGRLQSRSYETNNGGKRSVLEVVVSQLHFCGKKENNQSDGFAGGEPEYKTPQFDDLEDDGLPF